MAKTIEANWIPQLFDSVSGKSGARIECNPDMFEGESRAGYSQEEQLLMIKVLVQVRTRDFANLLERIRGMKQTQNNQARLGKVQKLIERLDESNDTMEKALQQLIQAIWT